MYCMMCIIHAGARYDSGYSCLPPSGFSDLFIFYFVTVSNVFVFQVQCQLHPSASRSKYFSSLPSLLSLPISSFLPFPLEHLRFFSSFLFFSSVIFIFIFLSSSVFLSIFFLLQSYFCFLSTPFCSLLVQLFNFFLFVFSSF